MRTNKYAILALFVLANCYNYGLLEKMKDPGGAFQETFTTNYYVFVSSWTTLGAMGGSPYADCNQYNGADRADCACTRAAISRNLRRSSSHVFRAWLSTTNTNAICRVQGTGNSCGTSFPGPWFNLNAQAIVNDFNSFTTGTLLAAIRYDEFGSDQAAAQVWTGTSASGATVTSTHCADWTDPSGGSSGQFGIGNVFNSSWTTSSGISCSSNGHIYCMASP